MPKINDNLWYKSLAYKCEILRSKAVFYMRSGQDDISNYYLDKFGKCLDHLITIFNKDSNGK